MCLVVSFLDSLPATGYFNDTIRPPVLDSSRRPFQLVHVISSSLDSFSNCLKLSRGTHDRERRYGLYLLQLADDHCGLHVAGADREWNAKQQGLGGRVLQPKQHSCGQYALLTISLLGSPPVKQIDLSDQKADAREKIAKEVQGMSLVTSRPNVVEFYCTTYNLQRIPLSYWLLLHEQGRRK